MVNTSKIQKELSPCIQFVIDWLNENGFDAVLTTYNTSKSVFIVNKDGVADNLEITATNERLDYLPTYLQHFAKSFSMKCENEKLKQELKARGISFREF